MYTLSKNLKLTAFIFMAVGAILFAVDYYNLPSTTEEVAAMEAAHGDGHGGGHETEATHDNGHGEAAAHGETSSHSEGGHEMTPEEHNKHVLGQYQNKPCKSHCLKNSFSLRTSNSVRGSNIVDKQEHVSSIPVAGEHFEQEVLFVNS